MDSSGGIGKHFLTFLVCGLIALFLFGFINAYFGQAAGAIASVGVANQETIQAQINADAAIEIERIAWEGRKHISDNNLTATLHITWTQFINSVLTKFMISGIVLIVIIMAGVGWLLTIFT